MRHGSGSAVAATNVPASCTPRDRQAGGRQLGNTASGTIPLAKSGSEATRYGPRMRAS